MWWGTVEREQRTKKVMQRLLSFGKIVSTYPILAKHDSKPVQSPSKNYQWPYYKLVERRTADNLISSPLITSGSPEMHLYESYPIIFNEQYYLKNVLLILVQWNLQRYLIKYYFTIEFSWTWYNIIGIIFDPLYWEKCSLKNLKVQFD